MLDESWKDIPGFPGYIISDHGNVRVWKDNMAFPVVTRKDKSGSEIVVLYRRNRVCARRIRVLMASVFPEVKYA